MRSQGVVEGAAGLGREDHVCWVYDREREFAEAARRFLADGLADGAKLMCVGHPAVTAALADAAPLVGAPRLLAAGGLELLTVGQAYGATVGLVPEQQLAFYDDATQKAIADGYTGLRVVAEITALAAHPDWMLALIAWEHLADDYMANGSGMSAMCAYDRSRLDAELLETIASVHPVVNLGDGPPPFRLYFADGRVTLAGVVDASGAPRLARILDAGHLRGVTVTLDVSELEFIDTAGCRAIASFGVRLSDSGGALEIRGSTPMFRRAWELL